MGRSEIATETELTVATTANIGNRWALIISRAWDMNGRFEYNHSPPLLQAERQQLMPIHGSNTHTTTFAQQKMRAYWTEGSIRQKETPPKAEFLAFSMRMFA